MVVMMHFLERLSLEISIWQGEGGALIGKGQTIKRNESGEQGKEKKAAGADWSGALPAEELT